MSKRLSGLGRGLSSLIPQKPAPAATPPQKAADAAPQAEPSPREVPIALISVNPHQPRLHFRDDELNDLAESIREHGIIQPLLVCRVDSGYEIIAGERRLRAAKLAGLVTVPVTVRDACSRDKLVLALIENVQRQDLDPIEEARAYLRLTDDFGLLQEEVAKQVGKARSTVANTMRLLELPAEIQAAVSSGSLNASSARAILAVDGDQARLAFFRRIIEEKIPVRETERRVRRVSGHARRDPAMTAAEEQLRDRLGFRVDIRKRGGQGSVTVSFYSDEEYKQVLERLMA
jgi:ParB family chromosome partitioning protein